MVSILLAAYNGAQYLPPQLDSLRQQQAAFRVIWQDDGSTDDTHALLEAVTREDDRFCPGRQQGMHLGPAGNFLSLLAQDDAPYTALCDQDDLWHADKLTRCLAAMEAAEALHGPDTPLLVHSDSRLIDASGRLLHASFFAHQQWDPSTTDLPHLLVQNNVTGCTLLMNAALRRLVVAHAVPEKLFMHDWFIALTAAAFGQVICLPYALIDYRQHGQNVLGASRHGLFRRALEALRAPARASARIRLTYDHARMFRETYGSQLPADAACVVDAYLASQALPKCQRIRALRQGDYLMQSRITRFGQMIFG